MSSVLLFFKFRFEPQCHIWMIEYALKFVFLFFGFWFCPSFSSFVFWANGFKGWWWGQYLLFKMAVFVSREFHSVSADEAIWVWTEFLRAAWRQHYSSSRMETSCYCLSIEKKLTRLKRDTVVCDIIFWPCPLCYYSPFDLVLLH